ncbi:hypothetical protein COJ96_06850 [Bacillus sp. AFS073361]|uniref:hypothetical protein n=1 Tax=Bacillus sp. AFS073361 TaxID=2033511 RepID=UPI000BF76F52|nr:hypothetical protein [Bacillus sp. AFS073361]PFP30131.1 hypothetical protein COJ96_06850 [Bacillus sp. AFS073361]
MSRITTISLAIYEKDPEAWAVGAELLEDNEVYHIFSYFLPRSEFPSKRQIIHYMFAELLPNVKPEAEGVRFISTLPHFSSNFAELKRKAGIYAENRWLDFRMTSSTRKFTVILAIDAVQENRRDSIEERLYE